MLLEKKEGQKKKAKTVVLAITDLSASSTHAVLFAINLLKEIDSRLILLNTFDSPKEKTAILISVEDILSKESETGLAKQAAEIAAVLETKKVNISTYSTSGTVKNALNKISESEAIDLVVAGIPVEEVPETSVPVLFIGKQGHPVLLVPENCSRTSIKSVLTLNFDIPASAINAKKVFENIINHNHFSAKTIEISKNEKSGHKPVLSKLISKQKADMVIVIPSSDDRIYNTLNECKIPKLYSPFVDLFNC